MPSLAPTSGSSLCRPSTVRSYSLIIGGVDLNGGKIGSDPTSDIHNVQLIEVHSTYHHPMITLRINGEDRSVDAPGDMPLLWVLRDLIGLTGTKFGCGIAQCGACSGHLDGNPVRSCVLPVSAVGSRSITTIEGIGATPAGAQVQKAWLELEVIQCGYCQSGKIMSATALLNSKPQPSDADINAAMAGNICRCGTYVRIRDAIKRASGAKA